MTSLFGANNGLFIGTSVENIKKIEISFLNYIEREQMDIFKEIEDKKDLSNELIEKMKATIAKFKESHSDLYTN